MHYIKYKAFAMCQVSVFLNMGKSEYLEVL